MRVRVDTMGCRVNRYDSAVLRGELAARGYEIVDEASAPVDLYVLNTCTVTHAADREARGLVSRIRRRDPSARVVVTGCYAETAPEEVAALGVDLVVSNRAKPALAARVDELLGRDARPTASEEPFPHGGDTRFFFKVQEGCDVRCTFCIIPDARGEARSLDPDAIIATAARARERGYRELILAGIHLGAYGRDLDGRPTLADLLRRVLDETEIERVRLGSLEPWGVRPALLALLRDEPRFLPVLHLPLQSGSERILRAMRRPITAARYLEVVESLFEARPDLALYLDVLVGFPGETEREHEETLRLLERFPWTKLHVFPYSARRGTPAAALPDRVPDEEKQKRVRALIEASDQRFAARMAARVGQGDEVLMERGGVGHTRDGFPCRVEGRRANELLSVRLDGLTTVKGAIHLFSID